VDSIKGPGGVHISHSLQNIAKYYRTEVKKPTMIRGMWKAFVTRRADMIMDVQDAFQA